MPPDLRTLKIFKLNFKGNIAENVFFQREKLTSDMYSSMDLCVRLENSSTALSPAIEWLRLPRSIKKPAGPGVGLKKGGAQSRLGERATFRLSYVLWGECRTSQEWSMWIRGRDAAQAN